MSLNHLDRLGTSIMKETAILIRIVIKLGENGSVYLDLASGKGNEELDSRIYHLNQGWVWLDRKNLDFFFTKFVSLCRSFFLSLCFPIPIKNPFYIFFFYKKPTTGWARFSVFSHLYHLNPTRCGKDW